MPDAKPTTVAKNNLSNTTVTGIMSYKSGDKLNIKSVEDMVVKCRFDLLL